MNGRINKPMFCLSLALGYVSTVKRVLLLAYAYFTFARISLNPIEVAFNGSRVVQ
jgi:hypothetical protein